MLMPLFFALAGLGTTSSLVMALVTTAMTGPLMTALSRSTARVARVG